ncbi:MAG: M48 family metalloprotease [Thioalkalispiraceae bacterium]|jgi:predicted Zn-dependent protease
MKTRHPIKILSLLLILVSHSILLVGCGVNPVTGKSELQLVSTADEVVMGEKNYAPLQQSEGGQYKVDPTLTPYVNAVGQKLVQFSDRKLPYEFVVINNSVPNAWALPGGKIAINRGLLIELNSEAELAAVLSHEIVHAAARHSAQKIEKGIALNIGLVALGASVGDEQYGDLLMATGTIGAVLLTQKYSRDAESQADQFGMRYMVKAGYDPYAAVSLQETFVRLSEGKKQNWLAGLFASHPPSQARVEANRRLAQQLYRPGLQKKEKVYQQQIAYLLRTKPAYDKEDEAYEALKAKNYTQAMRLVNQAIAIENNEAMFYALRGDIYSLQNLHSTALQEYHRAIELDNEFFYYYLRRGMAYKNLGNKNKAKLDLTKSLNLLPTKQAQAALQALN